MLLVVEAFALVSGENKEAQEELARVGGISTATKALQWLLENRAVTERALAVLCNLMGGGGGRCVDRVLAQGGAGCIVGAMHAYPKHQDVLEQACRALSNAAAADERCKEALVTARAERALVEVSLHHAKSATLQAAIGSALANLAAGCAAEPSEPGDDGRPSSPLLGEVEGGAAAGGGLVGAPGDMARAGEQRVVANRQSLLDAEVPEMAAAALRNHMERADVAVEMIALMRNLAAGGAACIAPLIAHGSERAVIETMAENAADVRLVTLGCHALCNFSCGETEQLVAVLEAGGAAAVLDALRAHTAASADLCSASLSALRHFAVDTWGADAPKPGAPRRGAANAVRTIIELGGVDAVLQAMRVHGASGAVLAEGCGTLRNLACGRMGDEHSRVASAASVAEAGGIDMLLAALGTRPDEGERAVAVQALGALRNLASGGALRKQLLVDPCIRAVVSTMGTWTTDGEVQLQGASFLVNLLHIHPRRPRDMTTAEFDDHIASARQAADAAMHLGSLSALMATLHAALDAPKVDDPLVDDTLGVAATSAALVALYSHLSRIKAGEQPAMAARSALRKADATSVQTIADVLVYFESAPAVKAHAMPLLCLFAEIADPDGRAMLSSLSNPTEVLRVIIASSLAGGVADEQGFQDGLLDLLKSATERNV